MTMTIGITGGIASGKSTVTNYLRQKGFQVIDADAVVHELQAKGGKLYDILVDFYGNKILAPDGDIDRQALSEQFFSDDTVRAQVSALQNTIIRQELLARRDDLLQEHAVVFMDIPLLFELDYQSQLDQVWLVYLDPAQQLNRLMKRNNYSEEQARKRIAAQLSLDEKRQLTDRIIDNSGDLSMTYEQVDDLLEEVCHVKK
ncbi:dephospho-CoA kinase [Streptococcus pluranimalium]|uniref:Dephospho-CoA kinase n=1 Tax=Streptococcus pluranimalium TaxID=82348 RepID=A0A345VIM8_9STRE|nr:dephospho-CoA kinase [Streptococcus pluranimalium]AXJ12580.1 Dephospho-CoA kinase [Streptococcus pluranimalium]